jgi:hypothetical protein
MLDSHLFLSLAEIAGVFVGFGALIAIRSRAGMTASDINGVRWVVTTAIWVVIVALAPIIVSSYGLKSHDLWLVSSLLALTLLVVMLVVFARTPENLAVLADNLATVPPAVTALVMVPTFWAPLVLLVLALVVVALGPFPDHEQALYLTAVALGLFMGAVGLFVNVFWRGAPQRPQTGGLRQGRSQPPPAA